VRCFHLVVSFLLISAFALSLGVEAFATENCSWVCTDEVRVTGIDQSISIMSDNSRETNNPGSQDKFPCADPCHFGQCHFGHCGFVPASNQFPLQLRVKSAGHRLLAQTVIEAPFLEGPRRPPRA